MSRVFIVGVAIEKIHNDLQHRLEKAYFFAWFTTEIAKSLCFHRILSLLLELKSVLPCAICLVPVIRRYVRIGKIERGLK